MAHLVEKRVKRASGMVTYYYIAQSVRKGERVKTKILEYLGKSPSRQRLAAAKAYWGVKQRPRKGGK